MTWCVFSASLPLQFFLPFQNFYENILDQKSKSFFSFILPKFILQQTFLLLFLENYSRNLFKMLNIINMLLVFLLKIKLSNFELNVSKFWIMRVPLSSDIFMKTLHAQ